MKLQLKTLAGAALLAFGTLAAAGPANAVPLAGCSAISPVYMNFKSNTPVHSWYSSTSSVVAWISTPQIIDASCISTAGNQWWRTSEGPTYQYIYDGYRIP
ncbi:hypothetical protein [Streptosporangium sp. NPDC051022]|uniref:hypothetical protein n=1 Tax=Streptosporangium sp. NPDC051022 TaxID=3155752 RepID=UPI00343F2C51